MIQKMKIPQAFRLSLVVGLTTAALVWMFAGNAAAQSVRIENLGSDTVSEGDSGFTTVTFRVSMSSRPFFTTTITFGIVGGTATIGDNENDDRPGVDYVPWPNAQTVDGGAGPSIRLFFRRTSWGPRTFSIRVRGDTRHEPSKTIIAGIAGRGVVGNGRATVTIEDDDPPPSLSIDSPSVTEGDDLIYTVSLNTASQKPVTVDYEDTYMDTGEGRATPGRATPGTDYEALSPGTLTFAAEETSRDWSGGYAGGATGRLLFVAGETSKTLTVSVTDDDLHEPDETVVVSVTGKIPSDAPGEPDETLGTATGTGTIENDDGPPTAEAVGLKLALAMPSTESIEASWNRIEGATGYRIRWWKSAEQEDGPATREEVEEGTSYIITGLTPDTEYTVRVIPTNLAFPNGFGEGGTDTETTESDEPPVQQSSVSMVLAGMGRTLVADAVDILSSRSGTPASRLHVTLGGQDLRLTNPPDAPPLLLRATPSPLEGEGRGEGSPAPTVAKAVSSPWQRLAGVAVGVAQALGVTADVSSLTGGTQGTQSLPGRFPAGAFNRGSWQSPLRMDSVSGKDLLARSAFDLPLTGTGADGGPAWTLWGRGAVSGYSGKPQTGFSMSGNFYGGYLGVDFRQGPMLMGLAVSHSLGELDYEDPVAKADMDVTLTSILPYAHWQLSESLGVWGMLGAGWGNMDIKTERGSQTRSTGLSSWLGAVGGRQALTTWAGIDLAAKTDAFLTTMRSDSKEGLAAARGHAQRVRVLMEGRMERDLPMGARVAPRLELGLRYDNGTAEQGLGTEIGGGLTYTQTNLGLIIDTQGRYLLAHQDGDFEDWGASLNLRLDPGARGQGAYLTVTPVWGRAASGTQGLWENATVLESVGGGTQAGALGWQPQRLNVDIGYGIALAGSQRLVTPYGGLAMTGPGTARYRLGSRVALLASRMGLNVEGERADQPGQPASHRVSVSFDWQW